MMTREEAIEELERLLRHWDLIDEGIYDLSEHDKDAVEIAIAALRHQEWEEQLWHDAKSDPPKTPGLYYGKKDATNSMYACQYRDGVWVLDMYPQQQMDIVQWADYTAFVQDNVEPALRPVSREQVEKVWSGCPYCKEDGEGYVKKFGAYSIQGGELTTGHCKPQKINFCPHCSRPLTDEAVDMMLERWREAVGNA